MRCDVPFERHEGPRYSEKVELGRFPALHFVPRMQILVYLVKFRFRFSEDAISAESRWRIEVAFSLSQRGK